MSNLTQSFQTPNEYIDYFCSRLTGAEFKILMVATRKITGWPQHRVTMSENISYTQLMKLTGIGSTATIAKAVKKLCNLGIFKKLGVSITGQKLKLVRFIPKKGQQEMFDEGTSKSEVGTPQKVKRPTSLSEDTKPNKKPINKNTHMGTPVRTPLKKSLKKQLEMNFTEPKQVVTHLREIASNGSEGKEAADVSLRILEQLWTWHQDKKKANEEFIKSWQWIFYAATMWPNIVNQAWGEIKDRKLQGANMKKPGAILTLRIKELKNDPKHTVS